MRRGGKVQEVIKAKKGAKKIWETSRRQEVKHHESKRSMIDRGV